MTPVRRAIERAQRYLARLDAMREVLDRERDKVVTHIQALEAREHDAVNLLPRFPGRALKAELQRRKREMQRTA